MPGRPLAARAGPQRFAHRVWGKLTRPNASHSRPRPGTPRALTNYNLPSPGPPGAASDRAGERGSDHPPDAVECPQCRCAFTNTTAYDTHRPNSKCLKPTNCGLVVGTPSEAHLECAGTGADRLRSVRQPDRVRRRRPRGGPSVGYPGVERSPVRFAIDCRIARSIAGSGLSPHTGGVAFVALRASQGQESGARGGFRGFPSVPGEFVDRVGERR